MKYEKFRTRTICSPHVRSRVNGLILLIDRTSDEINVRRSPLRARLVTLSTTENIEHSPAELFGIIELTAPTWGELSYFVEIFLEFESIEFWSAHKAFDISKIDAEIHLSGDFK